MAEVVNEILTNSTREISGEKAAMQPEVKMTEDEKEAEKILAGGADFEFQLAYEVIPAIAIKDASDIQVTRKVYDIPQSEIDEQIRKVAESTRAYETKDGAAEEGDRVTIDFLGKVDGEAFAGGEAQDQQLVLGSKSFIPGFEDQLIGVKAGDEKTVNVTFPADYGAANLAGKDASFAVTVKEVAKPGPLELNDETAKSLGLESLERLREIVKSQLESQYGSMTRQKVKRELLDALDAEYKFEAPSNLVDAEFNNIWNQVNRDLEAAGHTFADEETTEDEARAEYRRLAERRVRLGLVLAEIGDKAAVQVSDDELQRALYESVRRVPAAQQQQVFDFYKSNPTALANLRAPLFEEKVVDHLLSTIKVTDTAVSRDELMAEDEAEASTPAAESKPEKSGSKKSKAKDAAVDAE
jgi:trigger factor